MTGWIILGIYVAGVIYTSPRFARRLLANQLEEYPTFGRTAEKLARVRREYAGWGMLNGVFWPLMIPLSFALNVTHDRAYAKDLAAERELERAKLYAKAKEIRRQADRDQEIERQQKFNKELNS